MRSAQGSNPLALALALSLLLLPSPARAWEFDMNGTTMTLDLTDTLKYMYLFDDALNADYYFSHQIVNTLDASLSWDTYRLGGRFDLHIYPETASDDPDSRCSGGAGRCPNDFWAERLFFTVARRAFDVTLGDSYVSFGRGMALSMVKVSELGVDNAVRGGNFKLHHGDVEFTMVGGVTNFLDIDENQGIRAPWSADPLVAARLEYRVMPRLQLGAHAVLVLPECPPPPPEVCKENPNRIGCDPTLCEEQSGSETWVDHSLVTGLSFDVPEITLSRDGAEVASITLGGELDFLRTVKDDGVERGLDVEEDGPRGIGAYATATATLFEDLTVLAEFKYYDDFLLSARKYRGEPYTPQRYHQPPTLEWIRAEIANSISVAGGRVRVDYNFGELGSLGESGDPVELLVYVNFGYFENWDNKDNLAPDGRHRVLNPFAGVELLWMQGEGHAELSGGLRREVYAANVLDEATGDPTGATVEEVFHQDIFVELDLEQQVVANHSLKLSALMLARQKMLLFPPGPHTWHELELSLNYRWSPHVSAAFSYEYKDDEEDPHYPGGSVRYFFNDSTYVDLWAGMNKPGIKCLNGGCRYYPAFSGVRLMVVGRL